MLCVGVVDSVSTSRLESKNHSAIHWLCAGMMRSASLGRHYWELQRSKCHFCTSKVAVSRVSAETSSSILDWSEVTGPFHTLK